MTSARGRANPALEELEHLVAALEAELTALRARAATGTGRAPVHPPVPEPARQRIGLLEGENQLLRHRIAAAKEQVEQLRTRLRFIEDRPE